jgi:hypothetical protein
MTSDATIKHTISDPSALALNFCPIEFANHELSRLLHP